MVLPPALLSRPEAPATEAREAHRCSQEHTSSTPHTSVALCVSKGGLLVAGDQTTQTVSRGTAGASGLVSD